MESGVVHHFSEDPNIRQFVPHVPRTNPGQRPAVWAIDADHAPLYWFPRDCPRVTVWPRRPADRAAFEACWGTGAGRVHAIESRWLQRMRGAVLFRYDLPAADFHPWPEAEGQWLAHRTVVPQVVAPVGDLLALHAAADIELRISPSLWPLSDLARDGPWSFSIVRMRNAAPRA
jgi:hypothetical protein